MTYQALARKWRPRSFADLVGQEHVVRALMNGLERGQLHHAYLFTGTRGVGKTTLARILAKTLNCERGVGPNPCGECSTCTEIDNGRFVDLLEVDAASRTKVDQTRELLDNVPFAPVRGRHKVYLIDEVHMFSASSFNALLKTLEEPPEHVKFVLATTDPQRLPATVLSRCLQFNLKRLLPEQIRDRFVTVLEAEGVGYELPALMLLARAADGSMRDGLSLLDQAVAYGAGRVEVDDVRAMLGARGGELTIDLLEALADTAASRLLAEVGRIAELTPDFASVLEDLIAMLHRVALSQQVPGALRDDDPDEARLLALSQRISAEDVQLYYQVLLTGQADLALAPDPRTGLEMILLRALAFRPAEASVGGPPSPSGRPGGDSGGGAAGNRTQGAGASARADGRPRPVAGPTPAVTTRVSSAGSAPGQSAPAAAEAAPAPGAASSGGRGSESAEIAAPASNQASKQANEPASKPSRPKVDQIADHPMPLDAETELAAQPLGNDDSERPVEPSPESALRVVGGWGRLVETAQLSGLALELARHCALQSWDGRRLGLALNPAHQHLHAAGAEERLRKALSAALGCDELRLEIRAESAGAETPAQRDAREHAERLAEAERLLHTDPIARHLCERFDAEWIPGTLTPLRV
ncbi:DNA polymerase III subunit gamma/tau [Halochromatium glycolicum]|uniref:DNA polymerase III subunit gamma/tau n=1 Tax=Halochromatium glycolicum TaxID=85075 RepID=A0AAJ0U512_9GAMM|nr:DNA polymerase III subunit gamma/tau [Halochromatium glycolicum]MBK1705404.1 DNA polymerase III subunit gamma/tau [Halochromatium glycolicum]